MMRNIDIGAGLVALTLAVLVAMAADTLPPSKLIQTDYCWIDQHVAAKVDGHWLTGWAKGYGLCSEEDVYRNI